MPAPAACGPGPVSFEPGGPERGGESEFVRFYRGHVDRLVAYLIYQGASGHLAADVAQEAMIKTYERWEQVTSPRAYVWKVAYREFIRQARATTELLVAEIPEPAALLPDPEETEVWLSKQQVIEVLRALPERQRQVLALSFDGWKPVEIAELLDILPPAARSNLTKARHNAAEYLRGFGEVFGEEDS